MDAVKGQQRAKKAADAVDSDAAFERELARMLVREVGKTLESALGGQEGAAVQGVLEEALVDRLVVDGLFSDRSTGGAAARGVPAWRGRASGAVTRPVQGRITSDFGVRRDPFHGRRRSHRGVDLSAPLGAPVVAARTGTVRFAGERGGYGNLVIVDHGGGLETWYAHLDRIDVRAGSRIAAGRDLGTVGQTGRATGPHLHFEVREHGVAVDPGDWFGAREPHAHAPHDPEGGDRRGDRSTEP